MTKKTLFFVSLLLSLGISNLYAQSWVPSGSYGYVMIGSSDSDWYTWKTERGVVNWGANNQVTLTYSESASKCPSTNYCKETDTETSTYTVKSEKLVGFPGDNISIIFSQDDSVVMVPIVDLKEKGISIGIKLQNVVATGTYYMIGYERDFKGQNSGYHRLEMGTVSFSGDTATATVKRLCDGSLCPNGIYQGDVQHQFKYKVETNGMLKICIQGDQGSATCSDADYVPFGWVGADGKVAIISNTNVFYPNAADDFMVIVSLKKQDKSYSNSDLKGNWVFAGFGDESGQVISLAGNLICDNLGKCKATFKEISQGGLKIKEETLTMNVASDGSINNFELGPSYSEMRGAIGDNGQTMILGMGRVMLLAIKTPVSLNLSALTLKNGWNLVGLIGGGSKTIQEIVGPNQDKMLSIWKWVDNQKWGVYLPPLGLSGTTNYATSKGFAVIDVIHPGEGFWVNVKGLGEGESIVIE